MKVFITFRNSDTTEGRGPMAMDLVFLHREHAAEYIDAQDGVMGRRAKWSQEKYGDWTIQEVEVLDRSVIEAKKQRQKLRCEGLAKLTAEECEALGIKGEKND